MAMPMKKMTQRALWIAALIAMLTPRAAVAAPIIIISQHNLPYVSGVCSSPLLNAEGIAECKFAGDGRHLGRKLAKAFIRLTRHAERDANPQRSPAYRKRPMRGARRSTAGNQATDCAWR